jgi:membrane fusion protein (multidrug efflux system)
VSEQSPPPALSSEGAPVRTSTQAAPPAPAKRGLPIRRILAAVAVVVVLAVVGNFAYGWWTNGRFTVSTDDAYVAADTATVTAKVAGYVMSVPAKDNVHVSAGDPLVVLDDADYRNALAQANAKVATGEATIDRLAQQITAGQAAVNSAEAQLTSAQAAAGNAKADFDRVQTLESKSVATTADLDTARSALAESTAAVAAAEAGVTVAQANADVATAAKTEAERTLDEDKLAIDQAQLNLDHTVIRAPFDGVVGNGAAEPGEYVAPGQRLLAVVPLDGVYVVANFKETQLASLVPGQTAKVTVDAYPGMPIIGTVESVAPASGSVFSLLPPENATGNFTKIVQRVSVRIRLPQSVTAQGIIRPGMSIVASVDTRTGPTPVAAR